MEELLRKYAIPEGLSTDQTLVLLEKEKQKILRKLNHVFGNPEKEASLNDELVTVESLIDKLQSQGGKLSFDDVAPMTRSLSLSEVDTETARREEIRRLEEQILTPDAFMSNVYDTFCKVLTYHMDHENLDQEERWLIYGANKGLIPCMQILYEAYSDGRFVQDEDMAFYWLKTAADHGHKDSCEILGKKYSNPRSSLFDPQKAINLLIKAADREHPDAYLEAAAMFLYLKNFAKAETCLRAADQMAVPGAAYRLGVLFESGHNARGRRDVAAAITCYEKALAKNPDGEVCSRLGRLYLENGCRDKAAVVLKQGASYGSDACTKLLASL